MKISKKPTRLKVKEIEKITNDEWYPLILEQISVLLYLNRETSAKRNFIKVSPYYCKFALDLVEYWLAEKQEDSFVDKLLLDSNLDGSSYLYRINAKWIWLSNNIKKVYDWWYWKARIKPFIKERWTFIIASISLLVSIFVAIFK